MKAQTEAAPVMDRPATRKMLLADSQPAAGIKTILLHVHDDASFEDRLQVALSIARACGAHLHCLHVTPIEAYSIVDV